MYRQAYFFDSFLTFFLMPFSHMCCDFISKSTLPYLWQGAFSFCSFSLVCQFLLAGSGCSLTNPSAGRSAVRWGLLPSNIGLFSNPVSVSAHKQRAPGPFCGAKLFLSILPLFLPVVNLNEHPKKPLVISFRRKMRLFIRFESYELQFLIDFSKVPGTFTVVFRCKVHLILLSPPHQHHIPYIFCHSSFL